MCDVVPRGLLICKKKICVELLLREFLAFVFSNNERKESFILLRLLNVKLQRQTIGV